MIEGIEVLKTTALTENIYDKVLILSFIISVIILIISMIIYRSNNKNKIEKIGMVSTIISILLCIILGFILFIYPKQILTGKFEYEVKIDNSVNIEEFNNKYEVIFTSEDLISGEIIYTIREKE